MSRAPRILIFTADVRGGLAEHVYHQARALAQAGADVRCLVSPAFLPGRSVGVAVDTVLAGPPEPGLGWLSRRLRQLRWLVVNRWRLALEVIRRKPDLVLLDSFVEYLSPLWIWPHWFLALFGNVRYAASLHDPVRDYEMGPRWWHRLSVRLAFLPLDFVLVHHPLPDPSPVPRGVRVVQVPVGVYEVGGTRQSGGEWRRRHGIGPSQKIFLAFGYVRDGKNLHLVIEALASQPEAIFVMAGSTQAASDRGFSFYKELAARQGVLERCRFIEGFVPDEEVAALFAAADFIVLTYSREFHSQSGVLNVAARCRKPVLASSGPGPLSETVRRFELGIAVEPDSAPEVAKGMARLLAGPVTPRWDDYEAFASWGANAEGILRAAGLLSRE
jgi:glycosyltransferase involved in cell wall biosynthesis